MRKAPLLFLNVFIIATCGLIYELIAGTLASFVLGDSITQFSTCIGVYLFALGAGAWLSGFLDNSLERCFIETELGVALLGGFSAPLLFLSFSHLTVFRPILYGLVFGIGTLVGLELPLLMRILRDNMDFKDLVARVLTFDYIGALVASLAFPLLLVPHLGLIRTSLLFGLLNASVALWGTWILKDAIKAGAPFLRARACFVMLLLAVALIKADRFTTFAEEGLYDDTVVFSKTSSYQRIVVTSNGGAFNLYLNGNLQFSSTDEYRYHEALVHPAMALSKSPKKILVLGGGDGLAVREVLRESDVESVTLVDLDPEMTKLATAFPPLALLNQDSLSNEKVRVINDDAMTWLESKRGPFDVVVIDFPDPNNFSLGKLYTRRFFRMLKRNLADEGVVAIQCTSSMFTRQSYWCILKTMERAGLHVAPYHASVPTFGVWGFAAAMKHPFTTPSQCREGLRFLNSKTMAGMFVLPNDMAEVPVEINRLDNQVLVRYYENETSLVQ
jgi:spermidine synthase